MSKALCLACPGRLCFEPTNGWHFTEITAPTLLSNHNSSTSSHLRARKAIPVDNHSKTCWESTSFFIGPLGKGAWAISSIASVNSQSKGPIPQCPRQSRNVYWKHVSHRWTRKNLDLKLKPATRSCLPLGRKTVVQALLLKCQGSRERGTAFKGLHSLNLVLTWIMHRGINLRQRMSSQALWLHIACTLKHQRLRNLSSSSLSFLQGRC